MLNGGGPFWSDLTNIVVVPFVGLSLENSHLGQCFFQMKSYIDTNNIETHESLVLNPS